MTNHQYLLKLKCSFNDILNWSSKWLTPWLTYGLQLQLAIRAVGFQFHFTQDSGTEEGQAIYLILYLGKKKGWYFYMIYGWWKEKKTSVYRKNITNSVGVFFCLFLSSVLVRKAFFPRWIVINLLNWVAFFLRNFSEPR